MHVISKKPFTDATIEYSNDAKAIQATYKKLKAGSFNTPDALKAVFMTLDNFKYKDRWWVIDIGGNNLRLIAFIDFTDNRLFVKHITNHTEYDKLNKKYAKEAKQ
ncbi:MAG: type II toxin-antitoxin system HigB family toxin [Algicola sp.]|nr:type II toxin-antitoxin system HigB family toxin [Algicola sp.]